MIGTTTVEYLNPDGLHTKPAFSQVVVTQSAVRTVYNGGQNAINEVEASETRLDLGNVMLKTDDTRLQQALIPRPMTMAKG